MMWIIVDRLADVILRHAKGCIVEIGMGASTAVLVKHANQARTVLHSVDIDPRQINRKAASNHMVHIMKSEEFIKSFTDTPALVFIDGCHTHEMVRKEYDFFIERLAPGGVMFFHDTLPPNQSYTRHTLCGTVYELRHELEKDPTVDCFTWAYTAKNCGLTMVKKRAKSWPDVPKKELPRDL